MHYCAPLEPSGQCAYGMGSKTGPCMCLKTFRYRDLEVAIVKRSPFLELELTVSRPYHFQIQFSPFKSHFLTIQPSRFSSCPVSMRLSMSSLVLDLFLLLFFPYSVVCAIEDEHLVWAVPNADADLRQEISYKLRQLLGTNRVEPVWCQTRNGAEFWIVQRLNSVEIRRIHEITGVRCSFPVFPHDRLIVNR